MVVNDAILSQFFKKMSYCNELQDKLKTWLSNQ